MPQDLILFLPAKWPNEPFLLKRLSAMEVKVFVEHFPLRACETDFAILGI